MNTSRDPSSRIPVPSSPLPVRRSNSLRLAVGAGASCQAHRSAHSRHSSRRQSSSHGALDRSHSFMEQVGPRRPDSVNIAPRGPATPHSTSQQETPPRIRSLVSWNFRFLQRGSWSWAGKGQKATRKFWKQG